MLGCPRLKMNTSVKGLRLIMRSANASLDEDMLRKVLSFASPSERVLRWRLLSRSFAALVRSIGIETIIFVDIQTDKPQWFEAGLVINVGWLALQAGGPIKSYPGLLDRARDECGADPRFQRYAFLAPRLLTSKFARTQSLVLPSTLTDDKPTLSPSCDSWVSARRGRPPGPRPPHGHVSPRRAALYARGLHRRLLLRPVSLQGRDAGQRNVSARDEDVFGGPLASAQLEPAGNGVIAARCPCTTAPHPSLGPTAYTGLCMRQTFRADLLARQLSPAALHLLLRRVMADGQMRRMPRSDVQRPLSDLHHLPHSRLCGPAMPPAHCNLLRKLLPANVPRLRSVGALPNVRGFF